ncbi:preprotein translocase, SecA subunit [Fusobacterium necrophorum subsp. funduliforme ATCC 51357]|uniref:Protein translocase subunit SecA n=1 Tax=Fusobacterium necrophorum subsp. funduliforme TaxID=143387 RepID=A0A162IXT8_9FUSO|nr:preprotein translocase subunit SecA [Fusobacterium necrophorum]AVQ21068.1 preprotein translocase subunit SecA [Fusobacterium necrophorum subsp. funduliforme]AYV92774.1 preprotein translocase subunit SecA [Fusobacterium necrophorum subsp. funduliforme]EIJ68039.1 preprotein translocase, SecA subunit [Fusobacterium necrophorum subsp. funduliforme ATCC 51357]KAB0553891.1 preprotein translocase subunit SecA [Fusobacterium necrophorum subsp. funduliforme]KYL04667.1 preprotein translocase subunit 
MIANLLKAIFGTKNEREIKRIQKTVAKINALSDEYSSLSDEELRKKTEIFKERLQKGETLDDILVEAFATVREASTRVLGLRHYDVQLIGGIVLHEGKITEMKTGEGKTLVATAPVYLNALSGRGVHVITVNDYLATRDREMMGRVYSFLGLTSGVIVNGMYGKDRRAAYQCDITYGTNSEFGFDYLRDNMVASVGEKVQRELNYCIVDEVDSILIDEARTPLIISGASSDTIKWYQVAYQVVSLLNRSYETEKIKNIKEKKEMNIPDEKWGDYEVDEKAKNIVLTEKGVSKVEKLLKLDNLYSPENVEITHYINQALKAKELFKRDRDYLVRDTGEVVIIDEFTGRAMEGRRYSDGLHQAIEAKEDVRIAGENQTLATITLQNYFRMYQKLSGMTGTAETEATEFVHTYGLEVVVIPTNEPVIRKDHSDLVYKTKEEKLEAIIAKIEELYKKGQPVLVGTVSIQSSEELSDLIHKKGIPHNVLNAKYHAQEAEIVAQAGRKNSVTIATNMAGRGTDIMLGGNPEFLAIHELGSREAENYLEVFAKYVKQCEEERKEVLSLGGLYILGTERHESRRIDNQLRGRSGRQGDPGESQFFLSLEDDLMRLFGSDRVKAVMEKLGLPHGEPITHSMINKAIENAQTKIESRNFGIRKNLLEFDDVMNKQRTAIYASRNEALVKEDLKENILSMLHDVIYTKTFQFLQGEVKEDWDIQALAKYLAERFDYVIEDEKEYMAMNVEDYAALLYDRLASAYEEKENRIGSEVMRKIEKYILFEVVDARWREHLKALDGLREGIYLRAYGQKNPVTEYKLISSEIYEKMLETIQEEITSFLFKIVIKTEESERLEEISPKKAEKIQFIPKHPKEMTPEDKCSCGSGKKYKNCCGRVKK